MTQNLFKQKQNFFDRWASSYDILWTTIFYQAAHKRLLEFVALPENPQVLDLGCGTGRLLKRLLKQYPDLTGVGLDLSPEMLKVAQSENPNPTRLNFIEGNTEQLPFPDGQFDAIFCTMSFLHYPNPQRVLQEVYRVLKFGGHFYWGDITRRDDFSCPKIPFSPGGLNIYSPEKREDLLHQTRFQVVGHHYLLFSVLLTDGVKFG